jgi:hypothetical protein
MNPSIDETPRRCEVAKEEDRAYFQFTLPATLKEALRKAAFEERKSEAEVVREALEHRLKRKRKG